MATTKIAGISLAPFFAGVVADASKVETVAAKVMTYINVAEQIGKAWGLSGTDKLTLVEKTLLADLAQLDAPLAAELQKVWPKIAGVISGIIQVFNVIGWAFSAAAPIVIAAVPGATTAIAAVEAALRAVQALEGQQAPVKQAA